MNRPTPISDAAEIQQSYGYGPSGVVRIDDMRKMERQRDAAVEALKAYGRAGVGNSTDHELQIKAWAMANAVLREIEGQ